MEPGFNGGASDKRGILNEVHMDTAEDIQRRKKEARKSVSSLIPLVLLYFVLNIAIELLSFMKPICWVISVPLAAVVCAAPCVYMAKKFKKIGAFACLGVIWCIVAVFFGFKLSFSGLIITLIVMIVSELIRGILGYGSKEGICFGYGAAALLPMGHKVYLWTDTTKYMNLVESFLGDKYVELLGNFATEIALFLIIIVTIAAGFFSASFAIKLIRTDKKITERQQENSIDFTDV